MELKSAVYEVKKIRKRTRAKLFGDIKIGDRVQFSMELESVGRGSQGLHASYVKAENLTQGTLDYSKSQTEVSKLLDCFELVRVNP